MLNLKWFGRCFNLSIVLTFLLLKEASAAKICILLSDSNKIFALINSGLREGTQAEMLEITLAKDEPTAEISIRKFKPDLLIGVGNAAALWAKKHVPDLPCLASGIIVQGNSDQLAEVYGLSIDFPLSHYLKIISDGLPSAKKVGFIYNPQRGPKLLNEVKKSAADLGLEIVSEAVKRPEDFSRALQSIRENGAKVFLMTYDPIVMNSASFHYLVDFSIVNRIPLIVPSKTLLMNGGTVSLEADYKRIGIETAILANRIFMEKSYLESGKISIPGKKEIGVNLKMLNVLQIQMSKSFINNADYIHR